jgi:spore coat protein A, manganese oxidase
MLYWGLRGPLDCGVLAIGQWGIMAQLNRRTVLGLGAFAGAAVMAPSRLSTGSAATPAVTPSATGPGPVPGGSLDPAAIPKYVSRLAMPAAMPPASTTGGVDRYVVAAGQFRQQILPRTFPGTTVWGYHAGSRRGAASVPGPTIEAVAGRPVQVTWVNGLTTRDGRFRGHLLPIDPTLHWANPPGGRDGRDMRPDFTSTPGRYTGPVPIVTHLHGALTTEESDGFPEAWYLPAATDIPAGYARVGSRYEQFRAEYASRHGGRWRAGTATARYDNDQPATTLWYHDHTLGMTRASLYAGLAGLYLLRGGDFDLPPGVLPGSAPGRDGGDHRPHRQGDHHRRYEIPLVLQDRSFNVDGSLFYPAGRDFFFDDRFAGPYVPASDIPPIWNPETFGNVMVVNGRSWPELDVEPRRYRLRLLNASNARIMILKLVANPTAPRPVPPMLPFWQIGGDGGFLPAPVALPALVSAPAERADVIVDFTGLRPGTAVHLINEGPDPEPGHLPGTPFTPADPGSTGQVMRFRVVDRRGTDRSTPPDQLSLPGTLLAKFDGAPGRRGSCLLIV